MPEITIISGKGGTGKTSLTAAFARIAAPDDTVICDLDVDAPDLHLLLRPDVVRTEPFRSGQEAVYDADACTGCHACVDLCRFGAIRRLPDKIALAAALCEGCGVCAHFCPTGALAMEERLAGHWYRSNTFGGPMFHADLFAGGENSGLLVALLRREAQAAAKAEGRKVLLCDGPPGIGCPVISSLTGSSLAILVTEPTPSGRHDLERIADVCGHFGRPAAVVINKADLDPALSDEIAEFAAGRGYPLLARLPFTPAIVLALSQGRTMAEVPENGIADIVRSTWEAVLDLAAEKDAVSASQTKTSKDAYQ